MDTQVVCHPFIIGELACGNLRNRTEFLSLLQTLPMVPVVSQDELLFFIMQHELMGKGIGFVDINLLASAQQSEISLWTSDGRLNIAAEELGLAHS